MLAAGLAGFAAAQVLFTRLPAAGSYAAHLLPGFLIVAAALGLAFVGDLVASVTGVRPADAGLASGLINTSQQIGGAVGLAVTTTIATARTASLLHSGHPAAAALTGGFHEAFVVTGALALAATLVAIGFVRRAPAAEPLASTPPGEAARAPGQVIVMTASQHTASCWSPRSSRWRRAWYPWPLSAARTSCAPRPAARKVPGNEATRTGRHAGRIRPSRSNH